MTLEEVKEYFVTFKNAMRKINKSDGAYLKWRKWGYIPYHAQQRLQEASNGVLKAEGENLYVGGPFRGKRKKQNV